MSDEAAYRNELQEGIQSCRDSIEALCEEFNATTEPEMQVWLADKIGSKRELKRNLQELLHILNESKR